MYACTRSQTLTICSITIIIIGDDDENDLDTSGNGLHTDRKGWTMSSRSKKVVYSKCLLKTVLNKSETTKMAVKERERRTFWVSEKRKRRHTFEVVRLNRVFAIKSRSHRSSIWFDQLNRPNRSDLTMKTNCDGGRPSAGDELDEWMEAEFEARQHRPAKENAREKLGAKADRESKQMKWRGWEGVERGRKGEKNKQNKSWTTRFDSIDSFSERTHQIGRWKLIEMSKPAHIQTIGNQVESQKWNRLEINRILLSVLKINTRTIH